MAAMPSLSSKREGATKLPAEIIKHILIYLQPPSPETLGRARHEHIGFADEHVEAINQFTAASHKDLLPKLKTNDAEHKIGLLTLSNATRACKRFRDIARPLLYESFPGQPVANLQSLNRTLTRRPDLAQMVKNITISEWDIDLLNKLHKYVSLPHDEKIDPNRANISAFAQMVADHYRNSRTELQPYRGRPLQSRSRFRRCPSRFTPSPLHRSANNRYLRPADVQTG